MKKFIKSYRYYLVVFLLITTTVVVISCNKLDLKPLDRLTSDIYYKTPADFDGATFAAYSSIQDLWGTSTETLGERGEFWAITLAGTDDVTINTKASVGGEVRDLDNLLIRASDIPYAAAYTQIYEGILRANIVIEQTNNGTNSLTDDQKKQFIAEAKFLRGFFHFLALQMWGTPPLVLEVKKDLNNLAMPNTPQDVLFAGILKDFQDAYAGLPAAWDASNLGRANKWTARAFEGKVDVWKKDWPAAITAFEDVKNNGPYSLLPNYEDAFDFTKENGSESIFEVQYGGPFSDDNLWVFDDTHSEAFKASQGTGRPWYWDASSEAGAPGGGLGWYAPTQNLVDEYEAGDPRLAANIYKVGDTYYDRSSVTMPFGAWSSTGYSIRKYGGARNAVAAAYSPNGQAGFNNERYYRYADMLLLYAEALIASGRNSDAMDIINNQIRKRVGLGASPFEDATAAVRHERRMEFAFEPGRWFDITRWGIGSQVFGSAWKDKYKVFPFPQSEIDRSKGLLKQNPGY